MALTTETDTNEESQTRQLRVNKKLSKVISSVPRSRFQKPRPNVPGSTRTGPNVGSTRTGPNVGSTRTEPNVGSTRTEPNVSSTRTEPDVPVTCAKTSEKSEKNVSEKSEISTVEDCSPINPPLVMPLPASASSEKSKEIIGEKDEISTLNEKSEKNNVEKEEISSARECSGQIELHENLNAPNLTLIEDDNNCITLNTESLQNLEDPPEVSSPDKNKSQPIINSPDKNKNQPIINLSDKNKNQPILNPPDKNKNKPVTNLVSSAVISNTDRSSKYPHLTSILSKKRAEPRKEVQHKRHKKFKKGDVIPERSKMTMADLIYWNPVNPDRPSKNAAPDEPETETNSNYEEPEECTDDPVEESNAGDTSMGLSVPKLVIAEDGSINIDQSSLVVSRNIPEPTVTEVVRKDDTTYSSFRKRPMTKQWTAKDTTIFYKALSLVGTDFGLMEKIFPHRSRRELKLKFKREEKFNIDLINRAMYESHLTFDGATLEDLIEQLNSLISESDPDNKSKEKKQKEKKTKENKSTNIAQKKSTNRKRKIATELVEDAIVDTAAESLISEVTEVGTEVKKQKVRKKRKTKKLDDDFVESEEDQVSPNVVLPAAVGESKVKRNRKIKKLPEDFIDSDEMSTLIEDEMLEEIIRDAEQNLSDETEEILQSESTLNSSIKDNCETTNIEILCAENVCEDDLKAYLNSNKALIVPENATDVAQLVTLEEGGTISQKISLVGENAEEQCITVEYMEDVNQNTDTTLVNNVMAYEVVSSSSGPIPRRRKMNFTPKIPKKEKNSDQPPKISSTSYTPV